MEKVGWTEDLIQLT